MIAKFNYLAVLKMKSEKDRNALVELMSWIAEQTPYQKATLTSIDGLYGVCAVKIL
jgi:hypothetical protein